MRPETATPYRTLRMRRLPRDLRRRLAGFLPTRDVHPGAVVHKALGNHPSNPGAAARDQHNLLRDWVDDMGDAVSREAGRQAGTEIHSTAWQSSKHADQCSRSIEASVRGDRVRCKVGNAEERGRHRHTKPDRRCHPGRQSMAGIYTRRLAAYLGQLID